MKNKIIIFSTIAIGLIAVVFPVRAEEQKIVEAPKIYVDKVSLPTMPNNDTTGENISKNILDLNQEASFTIISQEDKDYHDVYYQASLMSISGGIDPKSFEAYNPKNWNLAVTSRNSDPLIVRAGEKKDVKFPVIIPRNTPDGSYLIRIQLYAKDYSSMGVDESIIFYIKGNNNFIRINEAFVVKEGMSFIPDAGVDFGEEESAVGLLRVKNISDRTISAVPVFTLYDRNQFNKVISETEGDKVELTGGESRDISLTLPQSGKPGAFLVKIQMIDAGSKDQVSGPAFLRFVVRGTSGRILELLTDPSKIKTEGLIQIKAGVIGSADSYIMDKQGGVIKNPEREGQSKGTLKVSLVNSTSGSIVAEKTEEVLLNNDAQQVNLEFAIQDKNATYEVRSILEQNGVKLDEKNIKGIIQKVTEPNNEKIGIKGIIILVVLALILLLLVIVIVRRRSVNVVLFLAVSISLLMMAGNAKATLTVNWSVPAANKHFTYYGNGCNRGPNSWIKSQGTVSTDVCQNAGGERYITKVYIDGILLCTVTNTISSDYSSGWYCTNASMGIESFSVGAHTQRVVVTGDLGTTALDSTRTFYVDDNVIASISATVRSSVSPYPALVGASVSSQGKSCTTASGGWCQMCAVASTTGYVSASMSGYTTGGANATQATGGSDPTGVVGIYLNPPSAAPTCNISWSPSGPITTGGSSTATWTSSNATSATYSCTGPVPGSGTAGTSGNLPVTFPSAGTENCTLNLSGPGGSGSCSASLVINPPANQDPEGATDGGNCISGTISLWGWAIDRDALSTSIPVNFYEGGVYKGQCATNQYRSDINTAYAATGNHGFSCAIGSGFSAGNHTITGYAINTPAGNNPALPWGTNPITVTCPPAPINATCGTAARTFLSSETSWGSYVACNPATGTGNLPSFPTAGSSASWTCTGLNGGSNIGCTATRQSVPNQDPEGATDGGNCASGTINLWGWAIDRDALSTSIPVHFYEGSTYKGQCATNTLRSDINTAYGASGNHGFSCAIAGFAAGNHTLTGYAINTPAGNNPALPWGTNPITVTCPAAVVNGTCGSANNVSVCVAPSSNLCGTGTPTAVTGSGPWNWNCNGSGGGTNQTCSAPKSAAINGTCGSANGGTYNSAPSSGFCNSGTASAISGSGPWTWTCNGSCGGTNSGTCTALKNNDPLGSFDTADSANCVASGWAYDPDVSSSNIDVHVYRDGPAGTGTYMGACTTSILRSDVNNAYGISGTHGFNCALSGISTGVSHSIYIYAINSPSGANPQLSNSPKNITCQAAINGTCGTANAVAACTAPVANFCLTGTATAVTGTGPWAWTCAGSGTGTTAPCGAPLGVTNSCGSASGTASCNTPASNLCPAGLTALAVTGSGPWTWTCSGGCGIPASCGAPILAVVPGVCGSANGGTYTSAPVAPNLCTTGTASAVIGSGPWTWTCSSTCSPTPTSCSANKQNNNNWKEVAP